ncbi:MAG: hypothetical protein EOP02_22065, partial [Proteobacteria bacterium]
MLTLPAINDCSYAAGKVAVVCKSFPQASTGRETPGTAPTLPRVTRPRARAQPVVESVTEFASRACEKLRRQNGHAGQVLVFIQTSAFRTDDPQYSQSVTVPLRRPTADSGLVASSAVRGLRAIYRPGFRYAKAGVMLLDLRDAAVEQRELDLDDACEDRSRLM